MNIRRVKKWGSIAEGGEFANLGLFAEWYPGRPNKTPFLTDDFYIYNQTVFKLLYDLNTSSFRKRIFTNNVWAVKKVDFIPAPKLTDYLKKIAKKAWAYYPETNRVKRFVLAARMFFANRKEAVAQWRIDLRAYNALPQWQKVSRILWRNLIGAECLVNQLASDGMYGLIQTLDPMADYSQQIWWDDQTKPLLIHSVHGVNRKMKTVPLPGNPWLMPLFSDQPVWLDLRLLENP
jgi:hypothetical protein